ncbi:phosphoenolpyruvate carboxylase, housekeeping isozyme isoform X3 [Panicum hallii]|uniref:phosphoenolpyruvate carboxylase, housekeeping isozyme isoform X3 n=1 Tax=Panicum hallii TaxID=206008 RepID=UPI000DF4E6D3|nr:phosphoenolpyruvate carboxylase, housekeeping isozyme isoform X3 [Panicum hallii]
MARNAVDKATSIDAQLRLLAPQKLSDDDKLVEYDALLLDRFLDILQDLHGEDIRETEVDSTVMLGNLFIKLCMHG